MITGTMTARCEPIIPLLVLDDAGQERQLQGVADTGFSGFLTLPISTIRSLRLHYKYRDRCKLADGSDCLFDVYEATVVWQGSRLRIEVESAETFPLAGMNLFRGCEIRMQVIPGGEVTIIPLS